MEALVKLKKMDTKNRIHLFLLYGLDTSHADHAGLLDHQ
jgi:hypothetical protein